MVSLTLLAVIVGVFAPVDISTSLRSVGHVVPAQEWVLARAENGAITTTLRDLRTGAVTTTFAAEPSRGDAVRFELEPVAQGKTVEAGQIVGSFSSGDAMLRLAAVRGDIRAAEADLRLLRAGARSEDVQVAEQDARRVEAQVAQARQAVERQRLLFADGHVSRRTLDDAESDFQIAQAAHAAALARRQATAAGPRPEAIGVAQARIGRLKAEEQQLNERLTLDVLRAPISGRIQHVFSPDTLLSVVDTSSYRLLIPIRWEQRERVSVGSAVGFDGSSFTAARIVDLTPAAARAGGQVYLVATAEVTELSAHLVPGLRVPVAIETPPQTPAMLLASLIGWQ